MLLLKKLRAISVLLSLTFVLLLKSQSAHAQTPDNDTISTAKARLADSISHKNDTAQLSNLNADIQAALEKYKQLKQSSSTAEKEYKQLQGAINALHKTAEKEANEKYEAKMKLTASIDSLQRVRHELDSTIKQEVQNKQDTLTKLSTSMEKTRDSIKDYQTELSLKLAELAKTEDSLEVIAKLEMVPVTYVQLDRDRMLKKLLKIDRAKRMSSSEKIDARFSVLRVMGDQGFEIVTDSVLQIMAETANYDRIPKYYRKQVKVYEINIDVNEGVMREILVKTNYGCFRNLDNPIDLVHIGQRLDDRLYRDGESKYEDEYILLSKAIKYTPSRSFNDLPYTQFNVTLLKDSSHKHESYWIKESTSINSYFDVALYTDLNGISGGANGLAQLMGNAKFIVNTRNIRGSACIPFNYVAFTGGISKFDQSFKGTLQTSGDSVNRKDLFQRANYYLGIKVNLLHGVLSPRPRRLIQDLQVNVGYNFVGSQILTVAPKDPAFPAVLDSSYRTATHNQLYLEPLVSFTRYRNFNMAVGLPVYWMNVKESARISNDKTEIWARPSIELMYYSKRTSNSKIFFRYNHWINLKTKTDAFFQMQMGYSASITDLFQSK